jgi:hypothetical protein
MSLSARPKSTPITGVTLDTPIHYNTYADQAVKGDIWDAAWADDQCLYTVVDDILLWNGEFTSNLSVVSMADTAPPGVRPEIVNPMHAYGFANELGADGACWKGNGITCVDGILYLGVSRHWYGHTRPDGIQIARDASIVLSRDHGQTWWPEPPRAEPFARPLFPGPNFATPFFVKYGRDGLAPTEPIDEADSYVYAVSNDGYWDNGNAMHLGRVARADLPNLLLDDWEFYAGTADGSPRWLRGREGLADPQPIIQAPRRCGQAGIQFIPGFNRYLMPQWSYPELTGQNADFKVAHSIWEWYEAPHLWGPWTLFQRWDWPTQGFYNPSIPSKFISTSGTSLWVLMTGDFMTNPEPPGQTKYSLYMVRASLHA